ncbi:hypothetical protein FRC03_012286 [Tulasnella sp. 419]|nr:hypothetical protein FRC02_004025 [Tulasnella sp. 418]KAG8952059.1 hypothetical protein FRC03_012286 [Tulasnella sp. 419]
MGSSQFVLTSQFQPSTTLLISQIAIANLYRCCPAWSPLKAAYIEMMRYAVPGLSDSQDWFAMTRTSSFWDCESKIAASAILKLHVLTKREICSVASPPMSTNPTIIAPLLLQTQGRSS